MPLHWQKTPFSIKAIHQKECLSRSIVRCVRQGGKLFTGLSFVYRKIPGSRVDDNSHVCILVKSASAFVHDGGIKSLAELGVRSDHKWAKGVDDIILIFNDDGIFETNGHGNGIGELRAGPAGFEALFCALGDNVCYGTHRFKLPKSHPT